MCWPLRRRWNATACVAGAHGGAARWSGRSVRRLSHGDRMTDVAVPPYFASLSTSVIGSTVSTGQACRNSQNHSQVLHKPAADCRSRAVGRPKDRPGADKRRVHIHSMDRSPISAEAAIAEYTSAFVPPGVSPVLDETSRSRQAAARPSVVAECHVRWPGQDRDKPDHNGESDAKSEPGLVLGAKRRGVISFVVPNGTGIASLRSQ